MQRSTRQHIQQAAMSLALAGAVFLAPTLALADDNQAPPAMHQQLTSQQRAEAMQRHHEMMMQELRKIGLSPTQWQQIKAADSDFMSRYGSGTVPTRQAIREHARTIKQILTPVQRETLRHNLRMDFLAQHPDGGVGQGHHHHMDDQGDPSDH